MKQHVQNAWHQISQPGALFWILFVAGLPFLAESPLLNDGPEIVSTALTGGTLHPPGFPLQSGIDQIVVWLPFSSPSYRLSMVSYSAHCGAAYFFFRILILLAVAKPWRVLLGITFFFGGPLLFLGGQPEVFGLAHFMVMASAMLWFHHAHRNPVPTYNPVLGIQVSLLAGLSLLTHPITVLAAPFWLSLARRAYQTRENNQDLLFLFLPGFMIWAFGYSTLMWPHQGFWPHWGGITTFDEVMDHFLRKEYGVLSLQEDQTGPSQNALTLLLFYNSAVGIGLYLALAVAFMASSFFLRRENEGRTLPVSAALLLSMVFAGMASNYGDAETAACVAYRFTAIPWMLALVASACFLSSQKLRPRFRHGLLALGAAQALALLVHEVPNLRAMQDNTFHLFAQRIQDSISPDDLYISHSDIEAFLSSAEHPMETLFPLEHSLYPKPWYREQLTQLRPYLFGAAKAWPDSAGQLYFKTWQKGHTLKATQENLVAVPNTQPVLSGLLYETHPADTDPPSDLQRLKSHLSLCNDVIQMKEIPGSPFGEAATHVLRPRRFAFVHALRYFYLRAFADAYELALRAKLPEDLNSNLALLIESLQEGNDPAVWVNACQQIQNAPYFSGLSSSGD